MSALPIVVSAVAAGLLGLWTAFAESDADYLPRMRFVLLGAVVLAWLGVAWFCRRKLRGWRRWGAILAAYAAVRSLYLPALGLTVVLVSWLDRLGRALGAVRLSVPVHYALPCFLAAFSALGALLALAALTRLRRVGWVLTLLLIAGSGWLTFFHAEDRSSAALVLLPHPPGRGAAPAPASRGPDYLDAVETGDYALPDRVLAFCGWLRHFTMSRRGWGAVVRAELRARFRGDPAMGTTGRLRCLEAALLAARPVLQPPAEPAGGGP